MKSWWLIALALTVTNFSFAQDEEFEREQRDWRENIDARYQAWLREPDRQRKAELEDRISQAIIHYDLFDRHELLDQLAAGGKFFEGEIKMPSSSAAQPMPEQSLTVTSRPYAHLANAVSISANGASA